MSSDSKVTSGPWRIHNDCGRREQAIVDSNDSVIAPIVVARHYGELIISAVNSCFTVCPSDPQAAAEAYPEVVKALRDSLYMLEVHVASDCQICGGKGGFTQETPERFPIMIPVRHKDDCTIVQARTALAKVGR